MSELDYHTFNDFIKMAALGNAGPGNQIEVRNMSGDKTHRISFTDHCNELCRKHNTNLLRFLTVIQQKMNGDMIVRLSKSPVFKDKLSKVIGEWGISNISPTDLFECSDACYDYDNLSSLTDRVKSYDTRFVTINDNIDKDSSDLYDQMMDLKNNYHSCDEDIQKNLVDIESRYEDYEPKYKSILCDLATKHKPFYLDELLKSDDERQKMIYHVNKKVNRFIPDNIHVIFLNLVIIPTLIAKELEDYKHRFVIMKDDIESKQNTLDEFIKRVGPSESPPSIGLLQILSNVADIFSLEDDEGVITDEESDSDIENDLKQTMDKIVDRSKEGNEITIDEVLSESPNKIYDLIIEDDKNKESQEGGAITSFF